MVGGRGGRRGGGAARGQGARGGGRGGTSSRGTGVGNSPRRSTSASAQGGDENVPPVASGSTRPSLARSPSSPPTPRAPQPSRTPLLPSTRSNCHVYPAPPSRPEELSKAHAAIESSGLANCMKILDPSVSPDALRSVLFPAYRLAHSTFLPPPPDSSSNPDATNSPDPELFVTSLEWYTSITQTLSEHSQALSNLRSFEDEGRTRWVVANYELYLALVEAIRQKALAALGRPASAATRPVHLLRPLRRDSRSLPNWLLALGSLSVTFTRHKHAVQRNKYAHPPPTSAVFLEMAAPLLIGIAGVGAEELEDFARAVAAAWPGEPIGQGQQQRQQQQAAQRKLSVEEMQAQQFRALSFYYKMWQERAFPAWWEDEQAADAAYA